MTCVVHKSRRYRLEKYWTFHKKTFLIAAAVIVCLLIAGLLIFFQRQFSWIHIENYQRAEKTEILSVLDPSALVTRSSPLVSELGFIHSTAYDNDLCLNLDGRICHITSDGTAIYYEKENGDIQTLYEIRQDTVMRYFAAYIENLEFPAIVISDVTGGAGEISIYWYDLELDTWLNAPILYNSNLHSTLGGYAGSDPEDNLRLADRAPTLTYWEYWVYHVYYDSEQGYFVMEQPEIFLAGLPDWWNERKVRS